MYTRAVDLWSFGCLLFELSTGSLPFSSHFDENANQIYERILKGKINRFPPKLPVKLKDLIKKLLVPDPIKRLGFRDYNKLLNHPFFDGVFMPDGKINEDKLARRPFKVRADDDFRHAPSISKDLVF